MGLLKIVCRGSPLALSKILDKNREILYGMYLSINNFTIFNRFIYN